MDLVYPEMKIATLQECSYRIVEWRWQIRAVCIVALFFFSRKNAINTGIFEEEKRGKVYAHPEQECPTDHAVFWRFQPQNGKEKA